MNKASDTDVFFDPAALRVELTALAHSHPRLGDNMRKEVLARLKALVADAHEQAERALFSHGSGTRTARSLSNFQDELLRAIYDFTIHHVYQAKNPTDSERLAIIAVGGYGRATLAPHSDIDLLFLHPFKLTAWAESLIEYMLYLLWDLGFKVGHATRNVNQCIRLAKTDYIVRTAILEARFLWGDRKLFATLSRRFNREIVAGAGDQFIEQKLAERDARHARAGESRYLVEPNVKEGKGGLRDLHTLFWIGKYLYRPKSAADLVAAGVYTSGELKRFERAEDFLWAVRCHLHFLAGRPDDRLHFERQVELAARLGYASRPGQRDVERFMKHYFLVAKEVGDLTRIMCAALEEREFKHEPVLQRVLGSIGINRAETPSEGFRITRGRLAATSETLFADDPVNLIRLFHIANRAGVLLHPALVQRASRSLGLIDDTVRNDPEANRLFLEIVTSQRTPEGTLRRMNETGVLGRFVPDFGRIVSVTQFSLYHHFTVDEHILRTVGIISEIEHGRQGDAHPLSHNVIQTIENRRVLYVAAFLHDIAKARLEDHSVAGSEIARQLCPRFGMTKSETETVAWLVLNHLVMSDVAQSRDLFDPKTIGDFAALVQSPERLKLLLIFTVADIRAVGPGVWNGWKGELLRTLYQETEPVLAGGHTATGRAERAVAARTRMREAMTDWSDDEVESFASRLHDPYWLTTNLERQQAHARLVRRAEETGAKFLADYQTDAFRETTQLFIYTPDHPRLLATIAGACAIAGADIVDAQIVTTADGWALDTVTFGREFGADDEGRRAKRIAKTIERSLRGEIKFFDTVGRRARPIAQIEAFEVEPQVVITNDLSDHSTVAEVAGRDRPGFLFDITRVLSDLNLNIRSAHVVTFGERAVDVFYVRDLFGHRITSAVRLERIRSALQSALAPDAAGADGDETSARHKGVSAAGSA